MRALADPGSSRETSAATGASSGTATALLVERVRFALALAAGKGAGAAGRLLNICGGTSFPGIIARRIDPRVLRKAAAASKARSNSSINIKASSPLPPSKARESRERGRG